MPTRFDVSLINAIRQFPIPLRKLAYGVIGLTLTHGCVVSMPDAAGQNGVPLEDTKRVEAQQNLPNDEQSLLTFAIDSGIWTQLRIRTGPGDDIEFFAQNGSGVYMCVVRAFQDVLFTPLDYLGVVPAWLDSLRGRDFNRLAVYWAGCVRDGHQCVQNERLQLLGPHSRPYRCRCVNPDGRDNVAHYLCQALAELSE